jgi:hypothetical protein
MRCGMTIVMNRGRDSREERHLSQMIRRKMISRDHGDKNKYDRKKERGWRYEE